MAVSPQKTVIILKHDAIARGLMGEIVKRFERAGLKLIAFKFIQAEKELAVKHYPTEKGGFRAGGGRAPPE